jgi:tRNA(fMet)-specific endonuclease VapC
VDKCLLDTDTFSEIEKGRNKLVMLRAREYRAEWGFLTLSAITAMEIIHGLWLSNNSRLLSKFAVTLANEEFLPFIVAAAALAGKIGAELDKRGATVGLNDPMIAATAIEHGLVLVTGNTRHYERLRQIGFLLQLANWRESDS